MRGPQQGAKTSVYLASSPEVRGLSERWFEKCKDKALTGLALDDGLASDTCPDSCGRSS